MGEEDTQDGSLLHCGDVSYSGRPHRLHLMHRGLRLLAQHREGKACGAGQDEEGDGGDDL